MENLVSLSCHHCGTVNQVCVAEDAAETQMLTCRACGQGLASVRQAHAQVAQEALGLGATDLRDEHVPVDGELGERPGR
jgi:hypothetical protein